ncbi:uncharacterized protein BXZ73DRAFT_96312 [Epithele typhae]|uniref:uncharacterized protein n=1 Tax=Epithele typhae TaxID=378194 RepID=UPI0020089219|nr:uncharacterized protein BXZ73DRAFT_96312 [Epithele typhae]KAH9945326.1 hypothetical protein BXZ73DRAFT_96312 [Epithele typhae]
MSDMVSHRLPPQDDESVSRMPPQSLSAYILYILPAERTAIEKEGPNPQDISKQRRYIGVLGGFLIEPVNEMARSCISVDIEKCEGSYERLVDLGQFYYVHYIRHFKSTGGPTPRSSSHPSRPSFDGLAKEIVPQLIHTPQNHSQAKQLALFRDGCAASRLTPTHCSHIIPESLNKFTPSANPEAKRELAAGFWSILERFGYPDALKELNGHKCHRLSNVLTLSEESHTLMDRLCLWYESTGEPNTYNLKTYPPELRAGNGWPAQVTFKIRDDLGIPGLPRPEEDHSELPNPDYLALHAACCKVAHLSGAAEPLEDSIFHDPESHRVLAQDGSSADVLYEELYRLVDPV